MSQARAKNRYYRHSRISEHKYRDVVRCLAIDLCASDAARMTGLSLRSVNQIFLRIRQRMAEETERRSVFNQMPDSTGRTMTEGMIPKALSRVVGKRMPLLIGLRCHHKHVYTEMIPDCSVSQIQAVISGEEDIAGVFQPGDWVFRYDTLADLSGDRRLVLQPQDCHGVPGIHMLTPSERFIRFTQQRLKQFMGIPQHTIWLHLKECEFRFNRLRKDLYLDLLTLTREHPL